MLYLCLSKEFFPVGIQALATKQGTCGTRISILPVLVQATSSASASNCCVFGHPFPKPACRCSCGYAAWTASGGSGLSSPCLDPILAPRLSSREHSYHHLPQLLGPGDPGPQALWPPSRGLCPASLGCNCSESPPVPTPGSCQVQSGRQERPSFTSRTPAGLRLPSSRPTPPSSPLPPSPPHPPAQRSCWAQRSTGWS